MDGLSLPWGTLYGSGKTVGSIPWGGKDAGRCELSPVGVSVNRSLAKGTGCASRDLEIGTESLELVAYKVYTRISQTVNSVRIVSSDLKYSDKAKIRVVSQRFWDFHPPAQTGSERRCQTVLRSLLSRT